MKIEENFVKGMAYYIGDGRMTNPRSLSTVNRDIKTIKFFIKWLKDYFNIKASNLKIHIRLAQQSHNKNKIKKELSRKLGIKEKDITSVSLKHRSKPHHSTIIEVFANNTKARKQFDKSLPIIKKRCEKNKKLAVAYIKGIMAAEGSVKHDVKSGSRHIHLKMKNENEIRYIGKLLNDIMGIKSSVLKIKTEKDTWLISVSGFYELSDLYNLDIFEIESKKKRKFKEIMKSYKRVQTKKGYTNEFFIKNLYFYNKKLKKHLTAPELARLIKRHRTRTINVLRQLEKKGLIKSKRKTTRGTPFEFRISKEARKFI